MQIYHTKKTTTARTLEAPPCAARQPTIDQLIQAGSWQRTSAVPVQRAPKYNLNDGYIFEGMLLSSLYGGHEISIKNNTYSDGGAFAGWSSIMRFETEDHKFTKFSARKMDLRGRLQLEDIMPTKEKYRTDQVVTRGVDTCTVITVSSHDKHVMAHLDGKDLNQEALKEIIRCVPLQPSKGLTKAAIAALIVGGMGLAGGVGFAIYKYLKGRTG